MTPEDKKETQGYAEECYLSYIFLRQISKQHKKLRNDLQNDFTTGNDRYPKTYQDILHFPDKCSKSEIVIQTTSEGTTFAQKGGNK